MTYSIPATSDGGILKRDSAPSADTIKMQFDKIGFKCFVTGESDLAFPDLTLIDDPLDETNLKVWLKLDEGIGTTAADASPIGNNGTIHGSAWVDGKIGKSLSFNGTASDYVALASAVTLTGEFTACAWVKLTGLADYHGIFISDATNQASKGFRFRVNATGQIQVIMRNAASASSGGSSAAGLITAGIWYHIAVVGKSAEYLKIYLNGELVKLLITTQAMDGPTAAGQVGTSWSPGTESMNGIIDEFRLYDKVLTDAQISEIANIVAPPVAAPTWKNFYALPWYGVPEDNTRHAKALSHDTICVARYPFTWPGSLPVHYAGAGGLNFLIEGAHFTALWAAGHKFAVALNWGEVTATLTEKQWLYDNCIAKNANAFNASSPDNIAPGWWTTVNTFQVNLCYQQQTTIHFVINTITSLITQWQGQASNFNFVGFIFDIANLHGDFDDFSTGTNVPKFLNFFTGGNTCLNPNHTHDFATVEDGHAAFFKQLRSTFVALYPNMKMIYEPWVLYRSGTPKTVTSITRSGATATVTVTAHGYATGDMVVIQAANETEYNGTFIITVTGSNTFTYTVTGTPASPATGTIKSLKQTPGDEFVYQTSIRSDKADLLPDMLSQESNNDTSFVDDANIFNRPGYTIAKDMVGCSQTGNTTEAWNRTVAGKAADNGAWYNWFGKFSTTGIFRAIEDVWPRLKFARCVPGWDNINLIPIALRIWDGVIYQSTLTQGASIWSYMSQNVYYSRFHANTNKLYIIFMTAAESVPVPAGKTVSTIKRVNSYFEEDVNGAGDLTVAGGNISLTTQPNTTIVGALTSISPANGGTIIVVDGSKFPSNTPFVINIDQEKIKIASRSSNVLTLASSGNGLPSGVSNARGYESTVAAQHANGATCSRKLADGLAYIVTLV